MPYVKKASTVKITMPSDKHYFVMWRDKVPYGALKEARSRAVILKMVEGETEPKPQFDSVAYNDYAVLAHIDSWNLDDENGEPLPLTIEGLEQLDEDDMGVLNKRFVELQVSEESERKNS